MNPIFLGVIFAALLAAGIGLLLEVGRRIGVDRLKAEGEASTKGFGAIEGAIFGLLGLILAFTFSGAAERFDGRRQLIITEANAIGTAWLRIDLLPTAVQPKMRDLFRSYLNSRIATYQLLPDVNAAKGELARSGKLQNEIWSLAVSGSQGSQTPQAMMLLLPALNEMIDITTTRTEVTRHHPPLIIFVMLAVITLACALFAGYDMGIRKRLSWLHAAAFAIVVSVTVYVIVEFEFPRLGLITVEDSDQVFLQLRESMN